MQSGKGITTATYANLFRDNVGEVNAYLQALEEYVIINKVLPLGMEDFLIPWASMITTSLAIDSTTKRNPH